MGVLGLPMLQEGDEAGSNEWSQDFVICCNCLNLPLGGAGGKGLVAHLVEGVAKFFLGGIARDSFG